MPQCGQLGYFNKIHIDQIKPRYHIRVWSKRTILLNINTWNTLINKQDVLVLYLRLRKALLELKCTCCKVHIPCASHSKNCSVPLTVCDSVWVQDLEHYIGT